MRWWRRAEPSVPDEQTVRNIIAKNVAIAEALPSNDHDHLVQVASELIDDKRWEPIGPISLSDEVLVTMAANAAIPILSLGTGVYRNVRSVLVRANAQMSSGLRAGPSAGVVNDASISTVGQATPNSGPISITWPVARTDSRSPGRGRNVVIHEFAHKIDMLDGYSDGTPPLPSADLADWSQLLDSEYGELAVDHDDDPLRPYAFTNPAEFFAVSTEAFFCTPQQLHAARPALYDALATFFRLDPLRTWNLSAAGS